MHLVYITADLSAVCHYLLNATQEVVIFATPAGLPPAATGNCLSLLPDETSKPRIVYPASINVSQPVESLDALQFRVARRTTREDQGEKNEKLK